MPFLWTSKWTNCTKTAFYHLRNLVTTTKFLSDKNCGILIHTFATSRIDYCNSLLSGLPHKSLQIGPKYLTDTSLGQLQFFLQELQRIPNLSRCRGHIAKPKRTSLTSKMHLKIRKKKKKKRNSSEHRRICAKVHWVFLSSFRSKGIYPVEVFIHPSCQLCLIVTVGILAKFLIWAVQNFVYPSLIYGCTPSWREGCFAPGDNKCGYQELFHYFASVMLARFSCNVSRNKDALQVESILTYTRNKSLFFEK